jgi:uncharacterized protein (DUF952 family)
MTTTRQLVFKVVPRAQWDVACRNGTFAGSADDERDGFIHLSTEMQLAGTLAKHFRGRDDLVLVGFDAHALGKKLVWEVSRGGDHFPHLYTSLPTALALSLHELRLGDDGVPQTPEDFSAC